MSSSVILDAPIADPTVLRALVDSEGGFTVRRRTGRMKSSGFSVALRPHRSVSFMRSDWSDDLVGQWLVSTQHGRTWYSPYVGGWVDPSSDTVFLDVVVVVPGPLRRVACWLGRITGQRFLFDLCHSETVRLR
jgi:hypothetical protein